MRLVNRVLAALLSLVVACAGVILIVEVIADQTGQRPVIIDWHPAYNWAVRTTWISESIRVTAGILLALGVVLLLAELKPARVSRLAVRPSKAGAADIDTAYTRRGVAAAVRSAVTEVDGVGDASVKVTRRKVRVAATAAATDKAAAGTLRQPVTAAAREGLAALNLRRTSALHVRLVPRSR
jgi:hypothetical protein